MSGLAGLWNRSCPSSRFPLGPQAATFFRGGFQRRFAIRFARDFFLLEGLRLAPRRSDQHPVDGAVYIEQPDTLVGDLIFADLIVMPHAAGFQDVKTPITLAAGLERTESNPGVDQGWDALISASIRSCSEVNCVMTAVIPLVFRISTMRNRTL